MRRRDLMKMAPAIMFLGSSEAQAETPIMALFRKHQELTAAASAHPSLVDEELERLFYAERDQIEEEMMALPALTARDMAAKMIAAHAYGDHSCLSYAKEPVWLEARALIGA